MKKIGFAILSSILLLSVILGMTACDKDTDHDYIEDFCEELAEREYRDASRMLHPDYNKDFSQDLPALENQLGFSLGAALDIDHKRPASTDRRGDTYTETYIYRSYNGKAIDVTIIVGVMRNNRGYGICDFRIDITPT